MAQDKIDDQSITRITEIAPDLPGETRNQYGETVLNFLGCLRKYLGKKDESMAISRNWNNKTNNTYIENYYKARILKYIDLKKPISDFTEEEVDNLISLIENSPGEENNTSIGLKCRQLFWDVYEAGFKHGEYEDQLFWDKRGLVTDEDEKASLENKRRLRQRSRKSLEIKEEISLFNHLISIDPKNEAGQTYGVLLMFFLGLRNNEAAGASFENVVQIPGKDFHALFVIKTTVGDTNELKIGGKTYNAARILPLVPLLRDMLFDRLKAITGKDDINEAMTIGGSYPIACRGKDYTLRCTRNDISSAAKKLFIEHDILKKDQYSYTEAALSEIMSDKLREYDIVEKNVTAYLLRRGTATHLYCLGMSPSQIQFFIGHDVEDQNELRNYFTNPDRLEDIYRLLLKHPFCTLAKKTATKALFTMKAKSKTYVRITADEPNQALTLKKNSPEGIKVTVSSSHENKKLIDISKKTDEVYLSTDPTK